MTDPFVPATAALYAPSVVQALLERYQLRADKRFGQNFLIDANILQHIVSAAQLEASDRVLEIGPGLGVLTRALAAEAAEVLSIELDTRLFPLLHDSLATCSNVSLQQGDALEFDFDSLPSGTIMVANLPYNIATPLLMRALESGRFQRLVVLIQKEVADRLIAKPQSAAYGLLTLLVGYFARVERLRNVAPSAFYPAPDVTSSVVRLSPYPQVSPKPELFALMRAGFAHRRKTLANNLRSAGYGAQLVETALQKLELNPKVRAEALSLEQFRSLTAQLHSP